MPPVTATQANLKCEQSLILIVSQTVEVLNKYPWNNVG